VHLNTIVLCIVAMASMLSLQSPPASKTVVSPPGEPCQGEGFIGGADGVWIMTVRGSLFFRDSSGNQGPVSSAKFYERQNAEPYFHNLLGSEPERMVVDKRFKVAQDGTFEAKLSLAWDEHRFCRSGRKVIETSYMSGHYVVKAPHCDDLQVVVTHDWKPTDVVMACPGRK
jgi:hypothetical protein